MVAPRLKYMFFSQNFQASYSAILTKNSGLSAFFGHHSIVIFTQSCVTYIFFQIFVKTFVFHENHSSVIFPHSSHKYMFFFNIFGHHSMVNLTKKSKISALLGIIES